MSIFSDFFKKEAPLLGLQGSGGGLGFLAGGGAGGPIQATGGSAGAKYVTREISLENPSTALDLRVAASIFPTSSIEVFRKVKGIDDDREMKDIPYVQMTQQNDAILAEGRSQSPYSDTFKTDFFDYEFSESGINEFTSFNLISSYFT